ncbi:related to 4-coumarate--CoA ligase 1 [Armillaria ostoyae]|uniref:Related to 4-coumarate--CoA ligase 1 n=1 Tax=Armillaria ostoyae TaxID=47428 RepID=A0A284S0W6_ARMOS|nr:related to 4-coumarate--CoA ligase 1 [Armillaria ostoyae]
MTDTSPWTPCCPVEEADKILTAPGSPLEIETRVVNGRVLKVWKNLWPSIRAFFLHSSKEHAHKTCVIYEKERYTFQEMLEMAVKCAAIFRDVYGVKKGDRVVICSRNFPSYYIVFWACHLLGAVTALVNAWLPSEPLRHCITLTKCSLIILDPERAERMEPIAADLKRASGASGYLVLEDHEGKGHWEGMDVWSKVFPNYLKDPGEILRDDPHIIPEDNATIIFTSGTTGLPKGVLSTQRAFLTYLFNSASVIGRDYIRRGVPVPSSPVSGTQDGILLSAPLFHASGCCTSLSGIFYGAKVILMRKWSVAEAVRLCKEENVISLGGVPSTIADLIDSPLSGSPIEMITLGGGPVAPSLLRKSKEAFPRASIGQAYGLTETNATSVGFYGPDYLAKPGSCGFVTPVNEILIMKDNLRAATGVVGEIWLRGPNMMKGYYGDQAATDKVLTKDGWVMTGDLGCVDEEGYVYIKDRIKDIIIRGGENIDSVSVENALYTEPGVLEAAAVGVPDERLGELVTALVTLKPGYRGSINEKKLLATARKLLPKFAVPVMIVVKDGEFDHTPSGKIIKAQLRVIAREEWVRRTKDGGKVGEAKSKL